MQHKFFGPSVLLTRALQIELLPVSNLACELSKNKKIMLLARTKVSKYFLFFPDVLHRVLYPDPLRPRSSRPPVEELECEEYLKEW